MNPTRCPYCAEEISPEAVVCPHCRSHIARFDTRSDPRTWHRDWPERLAGGVASAICHGVGLPLTAVRVGFVVLSFFHLGGAFLYAALWLFLPFRPGDESPLEQGLGWAKDAVRRLRTVGGPDTGGERPLDRMSGEPRA